MVGTDCPRESCGVARDTAIKIIDVRMYFRANPKCGPAFRPPSSEVVCASYFLLTEWISAMYPPGNCTTTASRSSVLYGGTSTATPLALARVSVSVRFVTSYPVVSLPYGYGR